MYDINMEGFYYKGFLDTVPDDVGIFTAENDRAICTGVMIINVDELIKDDMMNIYLNLWKKWKKYFLKKYHDQTFINAVCYQKVGILPPKFGIFNTINSFHKINDLCTKIYRYKNKYTEKEIINAYYNPAILHLIKYLGKLKNVFIKIYGGNMQKKQIILMKWLKFIQNQYMRKKFKKIIKTILIIGIILFFIKI